MAGAAPREEEAVGERVGPMAPPRRRLTAHENCRVAARVEWRCAACGELLDETYG